MTSHKINIGKSVYSLKQREDGTFNAYNCSTLREVKSENTMRKILKALAERDHEEALKMHYARETAAVNASRVQSQFRAAPAERQARWLHEAHAQALEFNAEIDEVKADEQWDEWANQHDSRKTIAQMIESDQTEALEINEAIDSMIAARQHIANKKPDFPQETWDLVRLGNSYKEAGRDWYRWAKATALRLWENKLTQRQIIKA